VPGMPDPSRPPETEIGMNRRGFLSLVSAAPAVLIPAAQAQSAPKPPAPIAAREFMVACMGPLCRGPGSYTLNHTGYAVPQSQCACEMMRTRNQAMINSLRSATITHT
jgi:hypothetical protein